MQLHQLKPIHKNKKGRRVGRGGVHGFQSGHGSKGQTSRSGRQYEPLVRQIIKRYPKLRGYKFKAKAPMAVVNVGDLEKKFQEKGIISPKILVEKGFIPRSKGRVPQVKILGTGELKKTLIIEGCILSVAAKTKIEKAGGTINIKMESKNLKEIPNSKQKSKA